MSEKVPDVVLRGEKVLLVKECYRNNGALALRAVCETDEPFAILTVNLPESGMLSRNKCFFKTWSENEGFKEELEKAGLIKDTGQWARTGFVTAPLVEILF